MGAFKYKQLQPRNPLSRFQRKFYVKTQYVEGIKVDLFGLKQERG